jgi:hypothetical protein
VQQVKAKVTEMKAIPVGGRRFAEISDEGNDPSALEGRDDEVVGDAVSKPPDKCLG